MVLTVPPGVVYGSLCLSFIFFSDLTWLNKLIRYKIFSNCFLHVMPWISDDSRATLIINGLTLVVHTIVAMTRSLLSNRSFGLLSGLGCVFVILMYTVGVVLEKSDINLTFLARNPYIHHNYPPLLSPEFIHHYGLRSLNFQILQHSRNITVSTVTVSSREDRGGWGACLL